MLSFFSATSYARATQPLFFSRSHDEFIMALRCDSYIPPNWFSPSQALESPFQYIFLESGHLPLVIFMDEY